MDAVVYVVVVIDSKEVLDPTLVGVNPNNDLRILGPFEDSSTAADWSKDNFTNDENFVILPLEWQYQTIY